MTEAEAKECIVALKGLFPKSEMTETEVDVFGFEIATRFEKSDAMEVIKQHRLKNDFLRPKLSQILDELRLKRDVSKAIDRRRTSGTRIIDALKVSHGKEHGRDYIAMGDVEFVLRYARALWRTHVKPFEESSGKTAAHDALIDRRKGDIVREAKRILMSDCGMIGDTAAQALTICFQHDDQAFNREAIDWNSFRSGIAVAADLEVIW